MNKGFFSKIFTNKLFLIILSFIISLTMWVSINMGDYGETSYVVSNIPITINLPENAATNGRARKYIENQNDAAGQSASGGRIVSFFQNREGTIW